MSFIGSVLVVEDSRECSSGIASIHAVSGRSPEELAQAAFTQLVAQLGPGRARALWAAVPKRPRGRPSRTIVDKDARLLPGILKFERGLPGASITQVVTAFVRDASARGHRLGNSEEAAINRLVKYRMRMLREGVARRHPDFNP